MSLSDRQCSFTKALAQLILYIDAKGYQVKIQELNRTLDQQKAYVAQGVSKTLDSRHLDKLAADLILFKDGVPVSDQEAYRAFGECWERLGGRWGGRFGLEDQPPQVQAMKLGWDPDHFEFHP